MFTVSVGWYDHFYADKDYGAEAESLRAIIEEFRPGARSLLDVACGTGRHIEQLRAHFDCEGVDASAAMIDIARTRLPDQVFALGDMAALKLGRRFGVVTCLFGSIGYMTTREALNDAFAAMAQHLTPGGVLIVEPWVLPENWADPGKNVVNQHDDGGETFVRVISSRRDGALSHLQIHYAVASGGAIETADEHHFLRLFHPGSAACGDTRVWR